MKKLLTLVLSSCLSFAAYAQMPRAGLVAYYPFNGNANNAAGTTLNMTTTGVTLATDRFGNANSAYLFNGTSGYMETSATGLPLGNSARTISAWFNATNLPGSYYSSTIIGYGSPAQTCNSIYGTLLWNIPNGGSLQLGTWKGCGGFFQDTKITYNYSLNIWYHLAATYDGAGNEKVYLNGVLINSGSIPALNTPTTGSIFRLGASLSPDSWFSGKIDEVAIYNRALAVCEIYSLYDTTSTASFATQPTSVSIQVGSDTTFVAKTLSLNSQYQWQVNTGTGFVNLSNAGSYSGVNTSTLSVNNVTANMNNYIFRCILTQPDPACNDTSDEAILTTIPTSVVSTAAAAFSIKPNPFSNEIIMISSQASFGAKITMELSEITGRVISRQIADGSQSEVRMQTGNYAPGTYFIRVLRNDMIITVQKFLKQ